MISPELLPLLLPPSSWTWAFSCPAGFAQWYLWSQLPSAQCAMDSFHLGEIVSPKGPWPMSGFILLVLSQYLEVEARDATKHLELSTGAACAVRSYPGQTLHCGTEQWLLVVLLFGTFGFLIATWGYFVHCDLFMAWCCSTPGQGEAKVRSGGEKPLSWSHLHLSCPPREWIVQRQWRTTPCT